MRPELRLPMDKSIGVIPAGLKVDVAYLVDPDRDVLPLPRAGS